MSYGGYGGNDYLNTAYSTGGGGFYTASQGGSQTSPSSEAKGRGSNTLRPVTIKQILEATQSLPDGPFKIDDVEISHITFVGRVRSVAEQQTNFTYVIDDGTGSLDVKQWRDAENTTDGESQQFNEQYVRVLGQLKSFNNKKHVGSHHIRLVTDFNEVMYHLLEAASIHLHLTRGPPEQFAPTGDGMAGNVGYNIPHGGGDVAMGGMHGGVVGGRGVGGGAAGGGGAYPPNSSHNARVVYETIKAASESNEGVHYKVIQMRSNLPIDAVTKGIEELVARGAAYTTLDENHVATMDF